MEKGVAASEAKGRAIKRFKSKNTVIRITVPSRLKYRCIIAARFAFFDAPMDAMSVVTHVPMFCPITIGIAAPRVIAPPALNAWSIPTDADEL